MDVKPLLAKLGLQGGCVPSGIPALDELLGTGFPVGHVTTLEFDALSWEDRFVVLHALNLDLSVDFESPWMEESAGSPNCTYAFEWEPSPEEFPRFIINLRKSNVACILIRAQSWETRKATKFYASIRLFVEAANARRDFKFKCVKTSLTARQGHSFVWTPPPV